MTPNALILNHLSRVLVNCWQGASRSATIVLAYMLKYSDLGLAEAVRTLKKARDVRPNTGFLLQLLQYESQLNKTIE